MLNIILRQGLKGIKSCSLLQRRTLMNYMFKVSEKQLKVKDKIDPTYFMIYKAPMEYYITACNHLTTASVVLIGAFAISKFITRHDEISSDIEEVEFMNGFAGMSLSEFKFFAVGLVLIAASIRMILYKYPLRIYRKNTDYIAVFEGQLPMTKYKLNFLKGEVKELPPKGIMPWREHRYLIKDRSTIMYQEYFKTLAELINMQKAMKTA